jgi:Ca-activated chloride channel family protein
MQGLFQPDALWRATLTAALLSLPVSVITGAVQSRPGGPFDCLAAFGAPSVLLAQNQQAAPPPSDAEPPSGEVPDEAPDDEENAAATPAADKAPADKTKEAAASKPDPAPAVKAEPPTSDKKGVEITVTRRPIHTTPIQVDVNLVVVNVTVTDPYDRIVTGLDSESFQVYDEKVSQRIVAFSTEDAPISVGMIFDSSGSMSDKIEKSKEAALQFFKTSNPQDEFMLINFSERPNLVSAFTSKFENLEERLITVRAGGKTALLDAIYLGLNEMKKATTNRKALLVISDGGDNHSRYTERDLKKAVKEADVEIYAVGVFEPLSSRARTPEEAGGPGLLAELAEVSGGRMFSVEDPNELPDIMEKISIELRNQYVLGYKPSNLVRDGRWRRIKVKLSPPKGLPPLQVYARTGYYAPTQ